MSHDQIVRVERSALMTPTFEVPSNGVVEISLLPVRTGETSI